MRIWLAVLAFVFATGVGAAETWQNSVRQRLLRVDALEPQNIETTNELIALAFKNEDADLVGEIADMYRLHMISQLEWRGKFVQSQKLSSVILGHLWLLVSPAGSTSLCLAQWEEGLCKEAIAGIQKRSPNLLGFYRQLAAAKTKAEFLRLVPPGAKAKSEYVLNGVRSAIDHFLSLQPTMAEIRKLALWMHDFDTLFFIQERALLKVKTAAEFLEITEYYYQKPSASYKQRVSVFLKKHLRSFMALNPTADELVRLQNRIVGKSVDLTVLKLALREAKSASEFVKAAQSALQRENSRQENLVQIRQLLAQMINQFYELEPNVQELNDYRKLMMNGRSDLLLIRYAAPKITRASDFLKLVRLFGGVRVRAVDAYGEGLREFMVEHIDLFLTLSPTIDEINSYREKMMDPTGDLLLLRAGFGIARSTREILLLATHFGNEPIQSSTNFDFVVTQTLVENLEKFISMRPSIAEIGYYRARMANPTADLRLLGYGLDVAVTKGQMLELVGRRPMLNERSFNQKWSKVVGERFGKFKGLNPSQNEIALYLRQVTDETELAKLRTVL